MSGFLKDNRCFRCGNLHAECLCVDELQSALSSSEQRCRELEEKYFNAQVSIKRLLVTYARRLEGNWYESTAEECGLELDEIGFIKEPKLPSAMRSGCKEEN